MKKKNEQFIKTISYVLLLLLILAVVGFFMLFTNGFTTGFKSFYATVDNKMIVDFAGGFELSSRSPLVVDVDYLFGSFSEENTSFSFSVVANKSSKDFTFYVDGAECKFFDETDLANAFDIEVSEQKLSVTSNCNDMLEVLQKAHPESICELDANDIDYDNEYFTLVIYSYDKTSEIKISFSLFFQASSVVIDKEEILI